MKQKKETYSREEAVEASLEYFNGDMLAASTWVEKYALKNNKGDIFEKTPEDMFRRIAKELHRIELKYPNPLSYDRIFELLDKFKYLILGGSGMAGVGNNIQISSLSNCFVSNNGQDSYGGIMRTDETLVQLMKRRGGVGTDLSHLRPKGARVNNSALTSSGMASFMKRYSDSTREVAQQGRRGALMLSISVEHPDVEEFIDAKLDKGSVTGANISVKLTDEFMQAVKNDTQYTHRFPVGSGNPQMTKKSDARALWEKIMYNAWKSAEPGVLFWDKIISESLPDCYEDLGYKTVSTNPCGEIPLCTHDSCRLMAMNLFSYVENPFVDGKSSFSFERFRKDAIDAQRIMDDIVDLELEKVRAIINKIKSDPESDDIKRVELELWEGIYAKGRDGRRTGLGVTAEGDMLAAIGLRYGTKEATAFSERVHKELAIASYMSSAIMAKERGAFPIYDAHRELENPFLNRIMDASEDARDVITKYGRRNIANLTIAPTGTVSIMTQTTSGIEPVFLPVYKRRKKVNPGSEGVRVDFIDENGDAFTEHTVFHHRFKEWMIVSGYEIRDSYSEEEIANLVSKSPYYLATANDIDWVEKVRMQGEVQKWVDHSISVTVNLPERVTEELVSDVYMTAWESGCKGMTIYRDGSRDGILISSSNNDNKHNEVFDYKRPKVLAADIVRFQNNKEKWVAFVGKRDGNPYEIFTGMIDNGHLNIPPRVSSGNIVKRKVNGVGVYDFEYVLDGKIVVIPELSRQFNKEYWNYAKLISANLRHNMPVELVVKQVKSLSFDNDNINSWKNGVCRALRRYVANGKKASGQICDACKQESLVYQEGCLTCSNCGNSKCG